MSDPSIPSPVTTPADLGHLSVRELLDAWHTHLAVVVDAHHGLGEPQPPDRIAEHALQLLAAGQALADAVTASRWVTVADALRAGARLAAVAAAMGVTEAEVAAGFYSWLRGQVRLHESTGGRLGVDETAAEQLQALAEDAATAVFVSVADLAVELGVDAAVVAAAVESLAGSALFDRAVVDPARVGHDVAAMVRLMVRGERPTDGGAQ